MPRGASADCAATGDGTRLRRAPGGAEAAVPRMTWGRAIAAMVSAVVTFGAFGVAVLDAPVAHAAPPKALILSPSVTPGFATDGSGKSLEQQQAELAGF